MQGVVDEKKRKLGKHKKHLEASSGPTSRKQHFFPERAKIWWVLGTVISPKYSKSEKFQPFCKK